MDILVQLSMIRVFGSKFGPLVVAFEDTEESFSRYANMLGLEMKNGAILKSGLPVGGYRSSAGLLEDEGDSKDPFDPDDEDN